MEAYATVLAYAIPGFVVLIIIESLIARWQGLEINYPMDTIASLSSGFTNTLRNLMGLSLILISYEWMVEHLAIWQLPEAWWLYLIAFLGLDFKGYWSHRWDHQFNLLWNQHIIHHSSEEFNLSCALRQEISVFIRLYFFLYIPLAIIGVPSQIIAVVAPLHLFAQFWYHTRIINKMGWLEYIIVTPSHHRVHHAINTVYLDKNFGQIFIFWDKLFGTYQEELAEIPPVYGTKRPAKTWNPFLINFMHLWSLIQDAWRAQSWWDKVRIWFMPTGWRPADVLANYPIAYYQEANAQVKYRPPFTGLLKYWSWAQLVINFLLMYYLMVTIADFSLLQILLYGGFLSISIFAYTTLMDRHWLALPFELVKLVYALVLIYQYSGWFGLDAFLTFGTWLVLGYCVLSLGVTLILGVRQFETSDV